MLMEVGFPGDLPVLMLQAAPPDRLDESYQWAWRERTRLIEGLECGKVVALPSGHSGIIWNLSGRIVAETVLPREYAVLGRQAAAGIRQALIR